MAASGRAKTTNSRLKSRRKKESPLVRIFEPDKAFLERLASERLQSMPEVLSSIIEKYRRQEFFEDLADAYAKLRSNADEWSNELEERKVYEGALLDGLKED